MSRVRLGVALVGLALAGCGLNVQSPDLFLLTRTGQGPRITLLVNDAGTIRCDGAGARALPGRFLIQARDIAQKLDDDVVNHVRFPLVARRTFTFKVRLQDGTITFPDTAAPGHQEVSDAELFTLQAGRQVCGLNP